jgi:hypothetical protein
MYLYFQPPSMLPIEQLWTSQAYKSYEEAQGRAKGAAGLTKEISSVAVMLGGLAAVAWTLMA